MMSAEVGDLHYVQYFRSHDLLNQQLGNYIGLLPSHVQQVPMQCEHIIVLSVSKVKFADLENWDQSQLRSDCTYPIQEVHSDQHVIKVMWDTVVVYHASLGWDVV
jgi:hypothetical protein